MKKYTVMKILSHRLGKDKCEEPLSNEYDCINFLGMSSKEHRVKNEIME